MTAGKNLEGLHAGGVGRTFSADREITAERQSKVTEESIQ
jgi:hypothetical protein